MISKKNFDVVGISDKSVILEFKSKEQVKINFSELNNIWVKKNKMSPIQTFIALLALNAGLVFYIFFNFIINFYILAIFFSSFLVLIKISNYKSYELHIILKNGVIYKKRIPAKLRPDTINIINNIQKKCEYINQ